MGGPIFHTYIHIPVLTFPQMPEPVVKGETKQIRSVQVETLTGDESDITSKHDIGRKTFERCKYPN